MKVFTVLKKLFRSKNEHFLSVNYDFYVKWRFIIKLIIKFNKNFTPCEIFRKKYKSQSNLVVVGLKWTGKNVKRRTTGFAKTFLMRNSKKTTCTCIFCEIILTNKNATADHIIPISEGGNNAQVNLIVTCSNCNNERGIIPFYDYLRIKNNKYKNFKTIFI
jgi:5-methylcytosine-specific restriction endonuclease McrA